MDYMSPSPPSSALSALPPPSAAPKSPPLAFAKTSNDSLSLPHLGDQPEQSSPHRRDQSARSQSIDSRRTSVDMGRTLESQLLATLDLKSRAIDRLHEAFEEERRAWASERASLRQYIRRLEALSNSGHHYSPAKSPVVSPNNGSAILSPQTRAANTASLPTITEDENIAPLATRREGAPRSIDLGASSDRSARPSIVSFTSSEHRLQVEEIPAAPVPTRQTLSPPPPNNLAHAGHTPARAPARPPTPPPRNMSLDGIEDTPTRHNTHINNFLTRSNDEDADRELRGPLNMPELPSQPAAGNFTFDALSKRLELIERDPVAAKPGVFATRSPGLASPADERAGMDFTSQDISPGNLAKTTEAGAGRESGGGGVTDSSLTRSPAASATLSPRETHDAQVHRDFEQGGIRLKKKPSVNFGAPFGSLGGFGGRKLS